MSPLVIIVIVVIIVNLTLSFPIKERLRQTKHCIRILTRAKITLNNSILPDAFSKVHNLNLCSITAMCSKSALIIASYVIHAEVDVKQYI